MIPDPFHHPEGDHDAMRGLVWGLLFSLALLVLAALTVVVVLRWLL